jgi:hypothetical protein
MCLFIALRIVKYEQVYLKAYDDVRLPKRLLAEYFRFYKGERRHQRLNNQASNMIKLFVGLLAQGLGQRL